MKQTIMEQWRKFEKNVFLKEEKTIGKKSLVTEIKKEFKEKKASPAEGYRKAIEECRDYISGKIDLFEGWKKLPDDPAARDEQIKKVFRNTEEDQIKNLSSKPRTPDPIPEEERQKRWRQTSKKQETEHPSLSKKAENKTLQTIKKNPDDLDGMSPEQYTGIRDVTLAYRTIPDNIKPKYDKLQTKLSRDLKRLKGIKESGKLSTLDLKFEKINAENFKEEIEKIKHSIHKVLYVNLNRFFQRILDILNDAKKHYPKEADQRKTMQEPPPPPKEPPHRKTEKEF